MRAAARRIVAETDGREHVLGVGRSAKGLAWTHRLDAAGVNLATAISQRLGLPEILGRVLAARGASLDNVEVLLNPTLKALMPDPSTLVDMDRTAARLAEAIERAEKVAIFGDYDVDGGCSAALMKRFLLAHGRDGRIYIPDRLYEGYGPNPQAIRTLIDEGAKLIVTVDCGTASHEALAAARGSGTDVLVIDHHQADERLPPVLAVVNPNRQDDVSGLGHLCAAGVVFLVLVATARELRRRGAYAKAFTEPPLLDWLDLVALATVCDVVPLQGLNRAYVTRGLQVMKARRNAGLKALIDVAALKQAPTPYHLGYLLGPRINAGGRIGDAALGAKLLATDDPIEAGRIAQLLDKLNAERKAMEAAILEEALARAEADLKAEPTLPILITGSRDWHKGLVGLVASRLTDRFRRPSCVIAWTAEGQGTGSLRSIAGVDIGSVVRAAAADGLLVKGGGHAMAAGLTVSEDKLEALKTYLHAHLGGTVVAARDRSGLEIDGALTPAGVRDDLIDLLEKAGPFGQGNPTPRFVFPSHRVRSAKIMGEAHIRVTIEAGDASRIEGVAFRAVGSPLGDTLLAAAGGLPIHIAGQLRRDSWGGRERIELAIDDVADPRG